MIDHNFFCKVRIFHRLFCSQIPFSLTHVNIIFHALFSFLFTFPHYHYLKRLNNLIIIIIIFYLLTFTHFVSFFIFYCFGCKNYWRPKILSICLILHLISIANTLLMIIHLLIAPEALFSIHNISYYAFLYEYLF